MRPKTTPLRGFAAVQRTLDDEGVQYRIVRHEATEDSYGTAPYRVVKAIALWTNGQLRVVAIPASERLDMHLVRESLGDDVARLATPRELSDELPGLDTGAMPPFGAPAPPLALVDRRVLSCNWVLANGGDHVNSVRVSPLEIIRLSHARVVDIAESQ